MPVPPLLHMVSIIAIGLLHNHILRGPAAAPLTHFHPQHGCSGACGVSRAGR